MPLDAITERARFQLEQHSTLINPVTECPIIPTTSLEADEETAFTDTDVEVDDQTDLQEQPNEDDLDESDFGNDHCPGADE